jgi:hypothetical protein
LSNVICCERLNRPNNSFSYQIDSTKTLSSPVTMGHLEEGSSGKGKEERIERRVLGSEVVTGILMRTNGAHQWRAPNEWSLDLVTRHRFLLLETFSPLAIPHRCHTTVWGHFRTPCRSPTAYMLRGSAPRGPRGRPQWLEGVALVAVV